MRIAVVGTGALGSVIGTLMLEAGLDLVFLDRIPDIVQHIRDNGIWMEGVSGERLIRARIASDPSEAGTVDLALVAVKSYDTCSVIPTLQRILSEDGLVLTLQNGIGNYETLNQAFPGKVLMGTTTMGAMTLSPGKFRHTGFGNTHIGEADGTVRDRTRSVGRIFEGIKSGPVHVVDNAMGCVWSKLIINAAINAPCTLLRVRNGALPKTEFGRKLVRNIVDECLAIVAARGITLIYDDPEAQVIAVCQGTSENINSMFQDVLAGRSTEIDFINGALSGEAERLGLEAPVNRILALLIKALEHSAPYTVPINA